jgi:hypothetical protein
VTADGGGGVLAVCVAYPLATQSQGDEGNAEVLAHRARLRGLQSRVLVHHGPGPLPAADIYCVGGLDESGVARLAEQLDMGGLRARVADGAGLLAVNAGFQAVGVRFTDSDGGYRPGLGLLEVSFTRGGMIEGPAIIAAEPQWGLPDISGYVSHYGIAGPVPAARRLGRHALQQPGAPGGGIEGVVTGAVVGTFLHGPVLARNPGLADLLLARVTGRDWPPASGGWGEQVRLQRIAQDRADPTGWGGTRYARTLPALRRRPRRR